MLILGPKIIYPLLGGGSKNFPQNMGCHFMCKLNPNLMQKENLEQTAFADLVGQSPVR